MASIPTQHQRQLESARENHLRQQERDLYRAETELAKRLQTQLGCTWSEAIQAAIGSQSI